MEYTKSGHFNVVDGIMVAMGKIEEMRTMYSFTEEEHEREVNAMYANNDL